MSNVYRQAITGLEQELDSLHQRAGEIAKAIEVLQPFAGPEEEDEPEPAPTPRAAKTTKAKPEPVGDVGPQESGRRQKILAALDAGPLATREIAAVIKVDRKLTKMALQRMQKVGLVKGVGVGPARRWVLAGSKPPKEGH